MILYQNEIHLQKYFEVGSIIKCLFLSVEPLKPFTDNDFEFTFHKKAPEGKLVSAPTYVWGCMGLMEAGLTFCKS